MLPYKRQGTENPREKRGFFFIPALFPYFTTFPRNTLLLLSFVPWTIKEGFIKHATIYAVSFYDGDLDCDCEILFSSLDEAKEEAFDDESISSCEGIVSSQKMTDRLGWEPSLVNTFDMLCTFYAEAHGYDGVWWEEELAPEILSAPRGVIFNSRLPEWSGKNMSQHVDLCR